MQFSKDLVAGLFFAAIGLAVVTLSFGYQIGTATRMGPGYFPLLVGGALAMLGLATAVRAGLAAPVIQAVRLPELRSTLLVLAGIAAFGLTVDRLGAIVATVLLIGFARAASADRGWREGLVLTAILIALAVGIFICGLGIPLRLLWTP